MNSSNSEAEYANARFFFKKSGRAVYISHLDLYRTFQRALKRARIPVWETQGFNKHIYLNFLLPLSLGTTGVREPLDLKLRADISFEQAKSGLNKTLPDGMEISDIAKPVMKAVSIATAEYEICGDFDVGKFRTFTQREEIVTEKRTKKKGISLIDLKPLTAFTNISENILRVRLPAGCALTVNPVLVIEAFKRLEDTDFKNMRITRTEIFSENGEPFI